MLDKEKGKVTLRDLEYNLGTKVCWPHLGPTYSPLSMIFNGFSFQTTPLMPLLPKIQTLTQDPVRRVLVAPLSGHGMLAVPLLHVIS